MCKRLAWEGGNAALGPVLAKAAGTVTRKVEKVRLGELKPGVRAYNADPARYEAALRAFVTR
ncbi:hypothetical protein [Nonomuraea sp. NPDC046570]|uniref:hypothetical protein n=1 Tax=Nonomuraea sp. NPDC046570 TaxID=3155255 RepID=UPI0033F5C0D1